MSSPFKIDFFRRDCLEVAPELVGKLLVRTLDDGTSLRLRVTETEAYRGEADTACHASKGRTKRTETLYAAAGIYYVYLCYGMHSLLNVVTGAENIPQAVLIRACEKPYDGPGKLTKFLCVDRSFKNTSVCGGRLYFEDDGERPSVIRLKRVGIDYATPEYRDILWRFKAD